MTLGVTGGVPVAGSSGLQREWDSLPEVAANNIGGLVGCDLSLCRSDELPKPILWIRQEEAIAPSCKLRGVIIITALAIKGACGEDNLVFDRDRLKKSGAVSLWFDADEASGIRIETVNQWRGHRPWIIQPTRPEESGLEVENNEE